MDCTTIGAYTNNNDSTRTGTVLCRIVRITFSRMRFCCDYDKQPTALIAFAIHAVTGYYISNDTHK
jgi:hypothetical protein